jgi:hypothetical protein
MPVMKARFGNMPMEEDGSWSIAFGLLHEKHQGWLLDWTVYPDGNPPHMRMVITADMPGDDVEAARHEIHAEIERAVAVVNELAEAHPLGTLAHIGTARVTIAPAADE